MEIDLERFNAFSSDEWAYWLTDVTYGQPGAPPLKRYVGRELDQDIVSLFRHLPLTSAERFRTGLRKALQDVPLFPVYARPLFWLLQIVSALKAPGVLPYLEQLIRGEALRGIRFAKETLHAVALNARAKFGVTADFVTYLIDSAHRFREYDHALLVLRLATQLSAERGLSVLPLLAHLVARDPETNKRQQLQTGRQIVGLAARHQYGDLTRWLVSFLGQETDTAVRSSVLGVLAQQLQHMPEAFDDARPHKTLFFAVVRSTITRVTPLDVLEAARQHVTVGVPVTASVLRCMWNLQVARTPDDAPWGYMPYDHPYLRNANRAVADRRDTIFQKKADPAFFEPESEPAVAELLRPFAYVRRDATVPVAGGEMYVGS